MAGKGRLLFVELVPEVSARGATVDREDGAEDCVMLSPNLEALEAADRK